jgi:hypothetical protein
VSAHLVEKYFGSQKQKNVNNRKCSDDFNSDKAVEQHIDTVYE